MKTRKAKTETAIFIMAVLFIGIIASSCVTPHQIEEVRADISQLSYENQETQTLIRRVDSLMVNLDRENKKFRNDVSYTTEELQRQIASLLENYNEMMFLLKKVSAQGKVTHVIRSSPGTDEQTSDTIVTGQNSVPVKSQIDCQNAYDEAFILVRQGEYENSISEFEKFLDECKGHSSEENAHYWIGECYYSLGKFVDAVEWFQRMIDSFKGSANSGRALYKLGRCHQELGKMDKAKKAFKQVVEDYPQTLEAEQSKERLKDIG